MSFDSSAGLSFMDVLVIDVSEVVDPDVSTVDAMAQLHLLARRFGCEALFQKASRELQDLIDLLGLTEVLRVEPCGQTEQREEVFGVEEEADPGDLIP
jgi:anti-anti-sigma regulatory factor